MTHLTFIPLTGIPLVKPGDDLGALVANAANAAGLSLDDNDILVVTQKIVSKAENRFVRLCDVTPSPRALELAQVTGKDPRLVEVILWDTAEVIRARRNLLIVAHRMGFICANAGVDHSNVGEEDNLVLRLPADPDESAQRLRTHLRQLTGAAPAVIINDSHGRPWREGTVGVAIGLAGLVPVQDLRGRPDLFGYHLQHTTVGFADQVAAAASLVMGQADERLPVVLVRGLAYQPGKDVSARHILRPPEADVFRSKTLYQLIRERRSIRRYADRPVERALIERLLGAAIWAPSAHNRQPWRFVVIANDYAKEHLADAMNAVLRADLAADGLLPDQIEARAARRRARLTRAPVLILLCMTMADMNDYPDDKRRRAEWTMGTQSLALAGQNLLLAAHAEGLGACWLCAPLFCPGVVRDTLDLPEDWEPQAFISLGWPDESQTKEREPLDTRVKFVM